MRLGAIFSYLKDDELQYIWSNKPDLFGQYPFSVNHLIGVLEGITTSFKSPDDRHSSCSGIPEILEKIKNLAQERESPVTKEHLEYLSVQRKKTML